MCLYNSLLFKTDYMTINSTYLNYMVCYFKI